MTFKGLLAVIVRQWVETSTLNLSKTMYAPPCGKWTNLSFEAHSPFFWRGGREPGYKDSFFYIVSFIPPKLWLRGLNLLWSLEAIFDPSCNSTLSLAYWWAVPNVQYLLYIVQYTQPISLQAWCTTRMWRFCFYCATANSTRLSQRRESGLLNYLLWLCNKLYSPNRTSITWSTYNC